MKYFFCLLLISFLPWSVEADVPAAQQGEVDHLLEFVKTCSCSIERNGTLHNGAEAYDHMKKKYEYFRDKIHSTEDFIDYAASKSTISGKSYLTHCNGGEPVTTREWLLAELERYRAGRP